MHRWWLSSRWASLALPNRRMPHVMELRSVLVTGPITWHNQVSGDMAEWAPVVPQARIDAFTLAIRYLWPCHSMDARSCRVAMMALYTIPPSRLMMRILYEFEAFIILLVLTATIESIFSNEDYQN